MVQPSHAHGEPPRGIAAVEMALLLPLLVLLFVAGVDFARVFYYGVVLDGCARNAALFARVTTGDPAAPFASAQDAALADARPNGLTPDPTVTVGYSSTLTGPYSSTSPVSPGYVQVTVSWTFATLSHYPGVPDQTTLTRACRMPVPAGAPGSN